MAFPILFRRSLVFPRSLPQYNSIAAFYPFTDGSGQVLTDVGPNGLHGQLGATAGVDAATDPTWVTEGLSFDGGDYVVLPGGGALDIAGTNMTVVAVFNLTADANPGQIFGAHGPNPFPGYALASRNGVLEMYTDGGINDSSGSGDRRTQWTCIVATLTAGTWTFRMNGNAVGSPISGASITAYTGVKSIGSNAVKTGTFVTGKVAILGVWSVPLSAAEAASVYRRCQLLMAQRGVTLPDPT